MLEWFQCCRKREKNKDNQVSKEEPPKKLVFGLDPETINILDEVNRDIEMEQFLSKGIMDTIMMTGSKSKC